MHSSSSPCGGDLENQPQDSAHACNDETAELSPKNVSLSRNSSSHEQCRICLQEKVEALIELGCQCRGDLAKAHRSCIDAWFRIKGSNKCEICQVVAVNVPPPGTRPRRNYWSWTRNPRFTREEERERRCFSPRWGWVAFSILMGVLVLDVLVSIIFGVSVLPVNIIIGVIVVLGVGTALKVTVVFCYEWCLRRAFDRAVLRAESNFYNSAL